MDACITLSEEEIMEKGWDITLKIEIIHIYCM